MGKNLSHGFISRCATKFILCMLAVLAAVSSAQGAGPLRVNPGQPRYFFDSDGRPVYLAGTYLAHEQLASGAEDFESYLDFLQGQKHNMTRLWAWEQTPATAKSPLTTLPYLRSTSGKALDGGARFDLSRFNQNYFNQLRARVMQAAQRGVYVSVVLFQTLESSATRKQDKPWYRNPFNRDNNVNSINGDPDGDGAGDEAYTLTIPAITSLQEAYVRKVVDTLSDLDNVLYELSGNGSLGNSAWQNHIINYLKSYQAAKPNQHPVGVSYAYGKEAEEIFAGAADWIVAYGADLKPPIAQGGKVLFLESSPTLLNRSSSTQGIWTAFTRGFNLIEREFDSFSPSISESLHTTITQSVAYSEIVGLSSIAPSEVACSSRYCLANPGVEYLIYLPSGNRLSVDLSASQRDFLVTWFDPKSGQTIDGNTVRGGGQITLQSPFAGPVMLHVVQTTPVPSVATAQASSIAASAAATSSKKNTVATPTITPNGATFVSSVSVSLSVATSGASIYFTTDGTIPSQSSKLYTGPITISSDMLLQARAFKTNANPSAIASARFSKTQAFDFSLANSGNVSVVAGNFVNNTITATLVSGITQGVTLALSALPAGITASSSAAACNPTCSTVLRLQTSATTPSGNFPLTVTATGGGITRTTAFTLTVTPAVVSTVATPTISPNGGSFTNSTLVTIATGTSGASIYYTTDGSSPTQSSTLYTGGISLTASAVVKAKAFKTGYNPSAETSASFTSNLVGYWKFDEGTGTAAADSSGNGNTGDLTNGPLWTQGRIGGALYFDGVDDNVTVADSASLNLSDAFTLSAWVNPSAAFSDFRAILVKNYNFYLYSSVAGYCGDGTPLAGFEGSNSATVCQATALPANTWTHLAVSYDGSILKLYRDGLLVATVNATGAITPSNGTLEIGGSQFGESFKGLIDEVRIYKTPLTDAEVVNLYQQESVGLTPTASAPVISPNGGSYTGSVTVAMQTTTAGASIYYTTDGSTPTMSSTRYSGSMTLASSKMIKAKAFKSGYNASNETDASFVVSQPFSFSLANSGNQSMVAGGSVDNTVSVTLDSGASQAVSFTVSGLPTGATASFSSAACAPACSTTLNITTTLSTPAGNYPITVTSSGGGVTKTTSFTLSVSLALVVATPTITPNGGDFSGSVSVAMQSTTNGASIYYTIDGSVPTQSSIPYTGSVTLASSTTVNAKAFRTGYNSSAVATASFVNTSTSKTYYVAKTGNDANTCVQAQNQATPKLTINGGISCLTSGDRLEIKAGTYTDILPQSTIPAGVSWSKPTTLARFGNDTVVLTGGGRSPGHYNANQSYIVWDGFIFNLATNFVIANGSHHIRVINFEIKNSVDNGVLVGAGSDYNEFINGSIHDTGSNPSGPPHALYIGSAYNLFERIDVYNSFNGCGFHLYDSGSSNVHDNIIRYNKVHDNRGPSCAGILVGNGANNRIYNNLVWNNTGHGIDLYHGANSALVYNNTVYNNGAIGLYVYASDVVSSTWKNNISFGNKAGNVYNAGVGTVMTNNLTIDPNFVNPISNDFRLQNGSPAIDAGINLAPIVFDDINGGVRPTGSAYDIGAYEYGN